ncbi:hypothetical protein [Psychrobacillus vulpis]|uniref:Uncharacterized protein n=1 Tax=Psychrobacillus vulpis TaxID=2325572 RepID=A0A544TPT2_9BACI|nr:hypothetical protein [Psychrobacillus vulpis]TQR19429.1 hypothetical protein FG384_12315 [Psychrobacillus vulpis]
MMKKSILLIFILLFLSFLSGCNQSPKIDIAESLTKSEKQFKMSDGIECVSAFDGDSVKFRLLLEVKPTKKEATILFEKILDTIVSNSNTPDTWDFYSAEFDLSYENSIIYEGNKEAGKSLIVKEVSK